MKLTNYLLLLLIMLFVACSSSNDPELNGTITLSQQYTKSSLNKVTAAVDNITITEAYFLIRDIKFKSQNDSTTNMFATTPLMLNFDMNEEVHTIGDLEVPLGTYNRIEFNIHKAVATDSTSMTEEERKSFRKFIVNGKYSIILAGTIIENGTVSPFEYKTDLNVKQKTNLDQDLIVNEESPTAEALLVFSSAEWFYSKSGELLDPRESKNSNTIDQNIRDSIHLQKR